MRSRLLWASLIGAALVVSQAHAQTTQPPAPQPSAPPPGPGPLPAEDAALDGSNVESVGSTIEQPPTPPPPPAPAPEPMIVHSGGISKANAGLLVGAGAGLAAGLCLFLAAQADDGDADAAASYENHERISARADRLRIASVVSAGAGIALGVLAIYRIKVSKEGTELAISPRKGGAALVLERSW